MEDTKQNIVNEMAEGVNPENYKIEKPPEVKEKKEKREIVRDRKTGLPTRRDRYARFIFGFPPELRHRLELYCRHSPFNPSTGKHQKLTEAIRIAIDDLCTRHGF